MTLLDPLLVAALEDAASLTPKGPMLATLTAIDEAIQEGTTIPLGQSGLAGRDGTQAAVLYEMPPNNSIRLVEDGPNRYIEAVAKLDPTLRPLRLFTASRVLNGPDQSFRTVTPIGNDPTYAELPLVYFQGDPLSSTLIADIPHDAPPGFEVRHRVDGAQSGPCHYRALGNGTVNGFDADNLQTLVVGAPGGALVVANPDGNSPVVDAWPTEDSLRDSYVSEGTILRFRAHHDRTIRLTGNVTVEAGSRWHCVVIASGAARTITQGGDVYTIPSGEWRTVIRDDAGALLVAPISFQAPD